MKGKIATVIESGLSVEQLRNCKKCYFVKGRKCGLVELAVLNFQSRSTSKPREEQLRLAVEEVQSDGKPNPNCSLGFNIGEELDIP